MCRLKTPTPTPARKTPPTPAFLEVVPIARKRPAAAEGQTAEPKRQDAGNFVVQR
jgi:hypothetical protein